MFGIPYFYIVQYLPTGQYYAGCKINKAADSSNFMKIGGYQTTSKIVKNLIKKSGLEAFKVLKIKHLTNSDETLSYESRFLHKVDAANNSRFLNQNNGNKSFSNKGGYKLKESTKRKMRKPKSQETIQKQNEEKRNRSSEVYRKMVASRRENNPEWNSTEARRKITEANIARFSDQENRHRHSEIMIEYYKIHPISEDTKERLRKASSGDNNPMFGKKHNEETIEKMKLAWIKRKELKNNGKI